MNKKEFQSMELEEQIMYMNKYMASGESLSSLCRTIGISKSISAKFLSHGYKLIEGQYILQQETISNEPIGTTGRQNIKKDTSTPLEQSRALKTVTEGMKGKGNKKIGRPQIHEKDNTGKNINTHKLTIEIDKEVAKALLHYKVDEEGFKINEFIENLIKENIPKKYFK